MELQLQNPMQVKIADLLWVAQTQREVTAILNTFGHDARVVYELMVAASFDNITDTHDADRVIKRLVDKQ